jgi:hypothetical protein
MAEEQKKGETLQFRRTWNSCVLERSRALPARPSAQRNMKIATLEQLVVASDLGRGILNFSNVENQVVTTCTICVNIIKFNSVPIERVCIFLMVLTINSDSLL